MSRELSVWTGSASKALDAAVNTPAAAVTARIALHRRRHPDATPADVCAMLDRQYLVAVTASGAAVGGTAAAPGVGTAFGIGLAAAEAAGSIGAAAMLALCYAEIHGVSPTDIERRRTLIMGVMLGTSGVSGITKIAERTGSHWGRLVTAAIPIESIQAINQVLGRNFVTKYGTKQGILVIGKVAPWGFGAAIGAGGNFALGHATVRAARRAFGEAPREWPCPASSPEIHEDPLEIDEDPLEIDEDPLEIDEDAPESSHGPGDDPLSGRLPGATG